MRIWEGLIYIFGDLMGNINPIFIDILLKSEIIFWWSSSRNSPLHQNRSEFNNGEMMNEFPQILFGGFPSKWYCSLILGGGFKYV